MFKPESLLDQLTPFDSPRYSRYTYENHGVPSVTELLGFIDNQGLIDWANAVGRKGINNKNILANAAQYGTNTHSAIENFLKGSDVFVDNSSFKAFKAWWDIINDGHKVVIIGQEEPLVNRFFAGTYDLLLSIDDKIYLVDFKTSNNVGYKYFMQLAAYRYLLYTNKGINIHGCIVLQLGKGPKPKFNEFLINFENPLHYNFIENCFKSFMGLVYTFYNVETCKKQFDEVFYK